MSQTIHKPLFGALTDPLQSIRRRSAACSSHQLSQQLGQLTATSSASGLRMERSARPQTRSYASVAATATAEASPAAPAGGTAVAATPVRPDQPGLAAVSIHACYVSFYMLLVCSVISQSSVAGRLSQELYCTCISNTAQLSRKERR